MTRYEPWVKLANKVLAKTANAFKSLRGPCQGPTRLIFQRHDSTVIQSSQEDSDIPSSLRKPDIVGLRICDALATVNPILVETGEDRWEEAWEG